MAYRKAEHHKDGHKDGHSHAHHLKLAHHHMREAVKAAKHHAKKK